jgi:CxxC-x17-CxxC domain-containing protein
MGEFRKSGGFGGNRGGGFGRGGDRPDFRRERRDGGNTQMFSATCAACKKACEVPFRPNGEKPVYCSDCFRSNKEGGSSNFDRRDNRDSAPRFPKRDFTPSFSPQPQAQTGDRRIDDIKKQLEAVNAKLEKIMQIIGGKTAVVSTPVKQQEKKVEAVSLKSIVEKAVAPAPKAEKKTAKKKAVSKKK